MVHWLFCWVYLFYSFFQWFIGSFVGFIAFSIGTQREWAQAWGIHFWIPQSVVKLRRVTFHVAYSVHMFMWLCVHSRDWATRNTGTQAPRNADTQELKHPGTQEPRDPGTQEPRNPKTQEPGNPGIQEPRSPGTQVVRQGFPLNLQLCMEIQFPFKTTTLYGNTISLQANQ